MINKFFSYYNSLCVGANTPSIFSVDPYVTAVKDLLVSELKQVVFYIEKLRNFEVDMTEYTDKVIEFISVLIVNLDFSKDSFYTIIKDLYDNKKMLAEMYISACEKAQETPEILFDIYGDLSSQTNVLKALNEIEKNWQSKNNSLINKTKKYLFEIMYNLVQNACNCLIELKQYGIDLIEAKNEVLKLLNSTNFPSLSEDDLTEIIKDFSGCNYHIMKSLYNNMSEKFGTIFENSVPVINKKGKAILVSGSSFHDLEKILLAVKGLNINVYTHYEMINAFQYEKFKKYSNLAGHYQTSNNNFPLDFASFPGPIYISRNSVSKIDMIRGQIYTAAKYPSYGIAKIENDDFSPIIKYALEAKGFDKDIEVRKVKLGYSPVSIQTNINNIIDKFNNGEIKKIAFIGLVDKFNPSNDYIKDFYKTAANDTYIVSFAYDTKRDNFWHVNSYFDFGILYQIIESLIISSDDIKNHMGVFLADCNTGTITHIFNLIYTGVKHIFLGPCCPNIINPLLIEGLEDIFGVNALTNPDMDIEKMN